MSEKLTGTDRRSFLKTGAVAAAPLAAFAPVAALADDASKARLARIEDERAIEALERDFLRRVNAPNAGRCGELFACGKAPHLGEAQISADLAGEAPAIAFAADGQSATLRRAVTTTREVHFTGDSTLEQMARLQGHGSHRHTEDRTLVARLTKNKDGWRFASVDLA
ncbi:hypothetical protein [Croceibacterium aestuarii]|uniref:hypothetical protein n=1 Tax=Croceibacterium aestuarii TaxID=3064139 RepID=UPI00272EB9F0|nr:hypothetical protein [Croceibacterium sp. D39]